MSVPIHPWLNRRGFLSLNATALDAIQHRLTNMEGHVICELLA